MRSSSMNNKKRNKKMKQYRITALEIVTHEMVVKAKSFDDACKDWHDYDTTFEDRVRTKWKTVGVVEEKN